MTPEIETEFLKELKKMNGFLEAIDWKLWNMHKKFVEGGVPVAAPASTTSNPALEQVAPVTDAAVTVPSIPKYPSIEKWTS